MSSTRALAAAVGLALLSRTALGEVLAPRLQDPVAPPGRTQCTQDAPDPNFRGMCRWLEEKCNASDIARVFVADFEHKGAPLRGLGVSEAVPEGELVFCISQACSLGVDALPEPDEVAVDFCSPDEYFALWLASEKMKGVESFYHPYFKTWPSREVYQRFHPAYLGDWELDESLDYWDTWLHNLASCHSPRNSPTWEEVKLAYVQLLTRHHDDSGLAPLLDMANTAPLSEVNVAFVVESGRSCLRAERDLPAGAELLRDYGASAHSPLMMFLVYGFALDREHHNESIATDEESEHLLGPKDGCAGLRPPEFQPPPDASPVVQHLARFSWRFCADSADRPDPRTEL